MRRRYTIGAALLLAAVCACTACGSGSTTQDAADVTSESTSIVEKIPDDQRVTTESADDEVIELAEGEVPVGVSMGDIDAAPALDVNWEQMDGVCGWLIIPGADVSVGIYAQETADGVWIDPGNYSDYTDPNTVIHGSAAVGHVLHGVYRYEDSEVYDANREIYVYAPDGQTLVYQIYAAYTADTEDILANHDAYDYDAFAAYVSQICSIRTMGAHIDSDLEGTVLGTWQMLTIQASDGNGTDYILQATLTGNGLSD